MTLKECYSKMGGDYEAVLGRLRSEDRVRRFALKFLDDSSFTTLERSMQEQDYMEAFRAAHTIKGICQNLSFTRLGDSSHELTEALRDGVVHPGYDVDALCGRVREDYQLTSGALMELKES